MNTLMYEHPLTNEHMRVVKEVIGYQVVGPIGKGLACGDVGEYHFVQTSPLLIYNRTRSNDRVERHCPDRG
jgi:hypothetical protein